VSGDRTGILHFLALLPAVLLCTAFTDPAPPRVQQLATVPAAQAKDNPKVTRHASPTKLSPQAVTSDWPGFMGPNHNGSTNESHLAVQWPNSGPPLVWEMPTGAGFAPPAVAGKYLVLPHRVDNELVIDCLDAETGRSYWQHRTPTAFRPEYPGSGNGPLASPTLAGGRAYIYSRGGQLICLDLATGRVHWQRDLNKEFKLPTSFFGVGTSPLVLGNRLIINIGVGGDGPSVAAFDTATGKMLWGSPGEWGAGYSSPVPAMINGKQRVFVFAGGKRRPPTGGLMSIDPANGAVDFAFPWRSTNFASVNASLPVVHGNRVLAVANYEVGAAALDIDGGFKHSVAWKNDGFQPVWSTPTYKDGHVYGIDGFKTADLICVDWDSGEEVWRKNPEWTEKWTANGAERSVDFAMNRVTLLRIGDRFLALSESGHLLWLDLSPKGYVEVARTWLVKAPETWSCPVLSRGLLYVLQNQPRYTDAAPPRLLCFDLRQR
jgi:outer membrane protein assembly factor BamB